MNIHEPPSHSEHSTPKSPENILFRFYSLTSSDPTTLNLLSRRVPKINVPAIMQMRPNKSRKVEWMKRVDLRALPSTGRSPRLAPVITCDKEAQKINLNLILMNLAINAISSKKLIGPSVNLAEIPALPGRCFGHLLKFQLNFKNELIWQIVMSSFAYSNRQPAAIFQFCRQKVSVNTSWWTLRDRSDWDALKDETG